MKNWLIIMLVLAASPAQARTHVRIHKLPPPRPVVQPVAVPIAAIPVLGMFYDLSRRTNCEGDVLGLGGPGFDSPITPATGNVMTTAYMRGECSAKPKR
jgi:hypothetical protein